MKKLIYLIVLALVLGLVLTGCFLSNVGQVPANEQSGAMNSKSPSSYGEVTLSQWQNGNLSEVWDLTQCDLTLSYTIDMSTISAGWVPVEVGLRQVGAPNLDPNDLGGFLLSNFTYATSSDPDYADLNDYHVLMKHGWSKEYYDRKGAFPGGSMPAIIPGAQINYAFWFDRGGVDEWQATYWNYKDGLTYNTGGVYNVVIQYEALGCTEGVMYATINGQQQGFYTQGYNSADPPAMMPVGRTFTGDMTQMQVFYGRGGGGGTVTISDITVDGCLAVPIVIESITINPVALGTETQLTAFFTGPTGGTATINWGDGTSEESGTVEDTTGTITGKHTYTSTVTGVYKVTVTLTITNECDSDSATEVQFAAVYDPSAGFVTGGGWIYSEAGAYVSDPSAEGKASFGFVSKYQKGATVPTGNTEFQFKAGNLNFHSESYDWLVIAGAKAMYKGTGTINGTGDFGFMLSAIDGQISGGGGVDKFRIKIWDKGDDSIIYDNKFGADDNADPTTEIGGGQIVIHKGK